MGELLNSEEEESIISEEPEIVTKPPIDERAEAFRPTLHRMFGLMRENDIYAVRIFTNKGTLELANADPEIEDDLENKVLEFYKKGSSGYFIFEGAHPEEQTVLFKLKLDNVDDRKTAHNELHFYQDLAPVLESSLEEKKIKIPKLLKGGFSEEGHSFIVTEFAEGEVLGEKPYDAKKPLEIEEFQELIEFIKIFQDTLTPEKITELSPELKIENAKNSSTFSKYSEIMKMYENKWNDTLEPEYIGKLKQIFTSTRELSENSKEFFNNQDINPANIIRTKDSATVIDWERLRLVPNPGAAYNHIIESHWRFPELQNEMIKRVLDLNEDDPNFRDLFRLDMLFSKYSFIYRDFVKNPNLPENEKEDAKNGLNSVIRFIKNAVDEKGPWKKN